MRLAMGWLAASLLSGCASAEEGGVAALAARIRCVGPEGAGNEAASEASRRLSSLGPEALLDVLRAMDGAGPASRNWLRASAEAIAERATRGGRPLPAEELWAFVLDRAHAGPVRRLAYEWLRGIDAGAPERLLPRMLDDPSVELRREAVAREAEAAQKLLDAGERSAALAAWRRLFASSRDPDQVDLAAKRLESLGEKPDLTLHYGCVQEWRLIGPFDTTGKRGFAASYAPEVEIRLDAEHQGKSSAVRWVEHRSADPFGIVDLNKALGKHMGVVAYAAAWVESPSERAAEVRVGSPCAVKVWLNGSLVLSRDEYHHGESMDQYRAPVTLRPGRNTVLVKVCQNEEKEEWTQDWKFQLRVCDPTGGGLL